LPVIPELRLEGAATPNYSTSNNTVADFCHCEERSDEAIQLDRHGAFRAPRDDKE
jgi:hypothetical protein